MFRILSFGVKKLKITKQFDYREIVTSFFFYWPSHFSEMLLVSCLFFSVYWFDTLDGIQSRCPAIQSNSSSLSTKEKSQRERRIGEEPRNNNLLKVYGGGGGKEKRLKHDDSVSQ